MGAAEASASAHRVRHPVAFNGTSKSRGKALTCLGCETSEEQFIQHRMEINSKIFIVDSTTKTIVGPYCKIVTVQILKGEGYGLAFED